MEKPKYYIASFSGGKDSTAMVLHLIERRDPLDEVIFCDTTMEFPAMLRHVEKVKQVIEAAGIKFTKLQSEHDFEYYLTKVPVPNRKPTSSQYGIPGYGWPSFKIRWCTSNLKTNIIKAYLAPLNDKYDVIQYIGIAADEDYRMERANNQSPNHRHPLRDWGWTEDDAMAYCRERGYDWEGVYEIFKDPKTGRSRVSCWCCPLSSYDNLRKLRRHFPELWQNLLDLDSKQWQSFTHGYSVMDIDKRFALEDELVNRGHSITNRAFHADWKRLHARNATIEEIMQEREAQQKIL